MTTRSIYSRILRVVLLIAALGVFFYLFRDVDPKQVWRSLIGLQPIYFIPIGIGVIGMPMVRAMRLKYIMAPRRTLHGLNVFWIYNIGQMLNILLPALTGQVGRVLLFSRVWSLTKTFAFTAVILEVLFDGLVLIVMLFAASFLVVLPDWAVKGEIIVFVGCLLLFGSLYLVIHRHRSEDRPSSWLRGHLPNVVMQKWDNTKSSFLAGLDMLTSRHHLAMVALLSVFSWLTHALIVMFLIEAFGFAVPFWGAVIVVSINTLAIMIPLTPGNLGVFQVACLVGLGFFQVSRVDALAFSFVLHLIEVVPVVALGIISSFSEHVRIREYTDADALADNNEANTSSDALQSSTVESGIADRASSDSRVVMSSAIPKWTDESDRQT